MDFIFPAQRIIEKCVTINPATNEYSEEIHNGGYFVLSPSDEEFLFSQISYDITIFFLWNMTEDRDVWSVVFCRDTIKNSSKLLEARAELKDKLVFATYGNVTPGMINPPLGAFAIQSKAAIELAAARHPIFARAWGLLSDRPKDQNWVLLIDGK